MLLGEDNWLWVLVAVGEVLDATLDDVASAFTQAENFKQEWQQTSPIVRAEALENTFLIRSSSAALVAIRAAYKYSLSPSQIVRLYFLTYLKLGVAM